jgi:hypothetical protein
MYLIARGYNDVGYDCKDEDFDDVEVVGMLSPNEV